MMIEQIGPLFNNLIGAGLKHRVCTYGLVWVTHCLYAIFPCVALKFNQEQHSHDAQEWCFGALPFSSDSTTQQGFLFTSHACLPKDSKHYGCCWHWLQTSALISFMVLLICPWMSMCIISLPWYLKALSLSFHINSTMGIPLE